MEEWNANQIICRICLAETGEFQTIFTSVALEGSSDDTMYLSEMICSFTCVQMTFGDGLPDQICESCVEQTVKMYFFKLRCEESDRVLRKRFLNLQSDKLIPEKKFQNEISEIRSETKQNAENEIQEFEEHLAPTNLLNDFKQDLTDFSLSEDVSDSNDDKLKYNIEETEINKHLVERIKEFECNICFKRFTREDLLLRHRIAHAMKMEAFKEEETEEENHADEINVVETADVEIDGTFNMDEAENTIIIKTDTSALHTCSQCRTSFLNEGELEKHLEQHVDVQKNEKKDLICKLCEKSFTNIIHFKKHMKTNHSIKKRYSCPHCFTKYTRKGYLKNHLKYHKEKLNDSFDKPEYSCNHCNKIFNAKDELNSHFNALMKKKLSSKKKPHVCEICLKAFNQISNLKDHLRTHNGEKPFLCAMCGKGFNQLGNLRQHQIRHSGVKSHLCSTCGNGFASKGELHAHLRKHTGARPFVCDVCGNGFTTSSSLTKHKRIHSGEKPYECDVCKMKFSRSGILSRHKRIHTGEKPYICKFCKKAFTQSNDLNSHLRIHTGEKPYICDECGQPFRQSSALRTHKKNHMGKNGIRINALRRQLAIKNDQIIIRDKNEIMTVS